MKRKLIVAAICFMLALVINVYLSEVVFQVVGRTFDGFSGISFRKLKEYDGKRNASDNILVYSDFCRAWIGVIDSKPYGEHGKQNDYSYGRY